MDNSIEVKSSGPENNEKTDLSLQDEKGQDVVELSASYTEEEEKALTRKIDMVVLPFLCLVFGLQYLDKQSLSYAGVFGVIDDLHLTTEQYSWCASMFYIGQLVSEFPWIFLLSRLPLTKFVGSTVIIWGIVCMLLAAPNNFAGFATVRFMLGFFEGAVSPAMITLTGLWYRPSQHAKRTAIWVTQNGIAQIVGSLLTYGIAKNGSLPLQTWRTLFLICGALTAASGVGFFVLMPSGPKNAWFLTARQKEVLTLRMAKDRDGGDKTSFSLPQLKETLLDPKAHMIFWFGVLVTMQSPVLTFASLVINNIGYDKYHTMLYTAPSGAVQIMFLWIGVLGCTLFPKQRILVAAGLCVPPFVGNILLYVLPTSAGWGVIVSAWLASSISSIMSVILSLAASNVKGNTKRSTTNTLFFIGYCAGCIAGPQLWTKPPRYTEGVITGLVTWVLLFIALATYRFLCVRDNKKRDAAASDGDSDMAGEVILDANGQPKLDLTDIEDRSFRYSI